MNIFKKKLSLIANVFRKLGTHKEALSEVSKKCGFTVAFDKQHGKGAQTHLKSSRRHLYHTYWSSIRILSLKKWLLVICKMLWLFVNRFTADDKYSLRIRDNCTELIWVILSQKRKTFSELFLQFWNTGQILNIFKKKLTVIANVFPKLRTPKEALR